MIRLDNGLFTVQCGTCDVYIDEAENGIRYYRTRLEAEQAVTRYGWVLDEDGEAWCPADAPEVPETGETDGQLPLPGVLP